MNPCISAALKAGKITKDLAQRLDSAEDLNSAIEFETLGLARNKREAAIQGVRVADGWEDVKKHPKGGYYGLKAKMARDLKEAAGYANVDKLSVANEFRYHSKFAEALQAFRTKNIGFTQDKEGLNKLVRALYGEAVDDPEIMKFAKQWGDLAEEMRLDFNAKGGSISKNEKWLLPQVHDARALLDAGLDNWKAYIKPRLDLSKMTDSFGKALNADELDETLDYVFETITTGGLNKVKDLTAPRLGTKISRRGSQERFLYFKKADDWMNYNEQFGKGNVLTTLTDHIQSKANATAMMEVFGPNPQAAFDTLLSMVEKTKPLTGTQKTSLKALWNTTSGKINGGDYVGLGEAAAATRNVITGTTLGGAMISAVGDVGFQFITAKTNGTSFMKTMVEMMGQLNPLDPKDQMFAAQIGMGLEEFAGLASTANRWADTYGTGVTAKVADGVMRASFLSKWTTAGRKATGVVLAGKLAENFGKSFDSLDPKLIGVFERYGIDKAAWDTFRKTTPQVRRGVNFADYTQPGGEKFHRMVLSELDFSTPSPDANTRAITTGGKERNSVTGVLVRTLTNLKSFPIAVIQTHGYRMANQEGMGKLQYAGLLLATTTLMGGAALQMKDIASGRTPRETGFEDGDIEKMAKFTIASMAQGGGTGILGDYLFSDVNRFGGGIASSPFGPTGELVEKTAEVTWGNFQQFLAGDETNLLPETIQYFKRYTPDVWQTRLLTDAMYDQLTIMADPRFNKKFSRQMRKRNKEYGQDYWWKKGEITPEFAQ